jgi:hypothetical protein
MSFERSMSRIAANAPSIMWKFAPESSKWSKNRHIKVSD